MPSKSNSKTTVLVIGAGPVGMTTAAELLRYGIHCRIVDQDSGPVKETRAPVLWPRTQEVYAMMGILDKWESMSIPFTHMEIHAYDTHRGEGKGEAAIAWKKHRGIEENSRA